MGGRVRVLVTGATGFLGSSVTRALLRSGYHVRAFARRPEKLGALERLGAEPVQGDILSTSSLATAAEGIDAIVHCAGAVSLGLRDRLEVHQTNVAGTPAVT